MNKFLLSALLILCSTSLAAQSPDPRMAARAGIPATIKGFFEALKAESFEEMINYSLTNNIIDKGKIEVYVEGSKRYMVPISPYPFNSKLAKDLNRSQFLGRFALQIRGLLESLQRIDDEDPYDSFPIGDEQDFTLLQRKFRPERTKNLEIENVRIVPYQNPSLKWLYDLGCTDVVEVGFAIKMSGDYRYTAFTLARIDDEWKIFALYSSLLNTDVGGWVSLKPIVF